MLFPLTKRLSAVVYNLLESYMSENCAEATKQQGRLQLQLLWEISGRQMAKRIDTGILVNDQQTTNQQVNGPSERFVGHNKQFEIKATAVNKGQLVKDRQNFEAV